MTANFLANPPQFFSRQRTLSTDTAFDYLSERINKIKKLAKNLSRGIVCYVKKTKNKNKNISTHQNCNFY